jgi:hypothetical protein
VTVLDVRIARAGVEQAGEILTVQRAAYLSEAQRYGNPLLPPLTQPLSEIVEDVQGGRRFVAPAWSAAFVPRDVPSCCTSAASPSRRIGRDTGSAGDCCPPPSRQLGRT